MSKPRERPASCKNSCNIKRPKLGRFSCYTEKNRYYTWSKPKGKEICKEQKGVRGTGCLYTLGSLKPCLGRVTGKLEAGVYSCRYVRLGDVREGYRGGFGGKRGLFRPVRRYYRLKKCCVQVLKSSVNSTNTRVFSWKLQVYSLHLLSNLHGQTVTKCIWNGAKSCSNPLYSYFASSTHFRARTRMSTWDLIDIIDLIDVI